MAKDDYYGDQAGSLVLFLQPIVWKPASADFGKSGTEEPDEPACGGATAGVRAGAVLFNPFPALPSCPSLSDPPCRGWSREYPCAQLLKGVGRCVHRVVPVPRPCWGLGL
jgi:hypothetical protein